MDNRKVLFIEWKLFLRQEINQLAEKNSAGKRKFYKEKNKRNFAE